MKPSDDVSPDIVLRITQQDLVKSELIRWGSKSNLQGNEYNELRAQRCIENSMDIMDHLRTIMKLTGEGEKVRIFPLYDTKNPNLGYQYLVPGEKAEKLKYLPKGKGYIDLDFNDPSTNFWLLHIVNLLYTGECAFVVKKPDGTYDDGEMIFAFDRDGYLEPEEIFSGGTVEGEWDISVENYKSHKMVITKYSTLFRGDNEQWRGEWSHARAWSTSVQAGDLVSYQNYIDYPHQSTRKIGPFIRHYMRYAENRYPGFREYLRAYLNVVRD